MKITKGRAVINRHQRRNVINTVSAQQYVDACTDVGCGPELHPDLAKCTDGNFSVACITNIVEEMVGYGKNIKNTRLGPKLHTPARYFLHILAGEVIEKRWKFDAVNADAEVVGRTATWHKNMCKSGAEQWSLPFDQVESRSQMPKFFSPSAINTTVPLADVHLRRG